MPASAVYAYKKNCSVKAVKGVVESVVGSSSISIIELKMMIVKIRFSNLLDLTIFQQV